mmetsp:Transcript_971/g.2373  ORF Transcript_971/g.2373 Transcript_971/m.2373 type:complete len:180 (+) Transcript_971:616-1155(+)
MSQLGTTNRLKLLLTRPDVLSALAPPPPPPAADLLQSQAQQARVSRQQVSQSLQTQKQALENRLRARRASSGPKRKPQDESDKSGGRPSKAILMAQYEKEFESLMERHVTEKLKRTADVRAHYQSQMAEVSRLGCDAEALLRLQAQLQTNMELEIRHTTEALEQQKTQELSALKRRLLV